MVKILDNNYGGILYFVVNSEMPEGFHLEAIIEQQEYINRTGEKIRIKKCPIRAQLEVIVGFNYFPGNILPGKIVTKETINQVEDDPELYLKWDSNGNVCRTFDGKAIYTYSYYTEDVLEKDEFI